MNRPDQRNNNQLRKIKIIPDFVSCAEASCLIEIGKTRVLCNATVDEKVPIWMRNTKKGWITAEYSLLPRSTNERVQRERKSISGRTQEIQRLIGRSLRGVCQLDKLGERSITIDCDVIEADGGTRCAAITGGFFVLAKAIQNLKNANLITHEFPVLKYWLSAISVGILNNTPILDLCYQEDSKAEVDMNVVMTDSRNFVEIQGTGEESTYSRKDFERTIRLE